MRDWRRFACVVLVAAAGCGRGDRPPLAPVTGSVTYLGKPLVRGRISLFPETGRSSEGRIVDGRIVDVSTFDKGDGAVVGRHRIQIASFVSEPGGMDMTPGQWAIPERYGHVETSDLSADIVRGRDNVLHLELR